MTISASAHETLDALERANRIGPDLSLFWLAPDQEDRTEEGWIVMGTPNKRVVEKIIFPMSLDLWEGEGVLSIEYMYRDASNYKQFDTAYIKGTFTYEDFCLILTALMRGDDACFIPHQLDLPDLQGRWDNKGWQEQDDHVWHEVCSIAMLTPHHQDLAPLEKSTWMPVVAKRAKDGYNLMAALNLLAPEYY